MRDPSKYLWEMVSIAEGLKGDPNDRRWKLREGVKIFGPKQEAKCPHCEEWIPTNRIWLVDESKKALLRVWTADGKRVAPSYDSNDGELTIVHPHATPQGHICMGHGSEKLDSASDALFHGVNTGFHYYSSELWFEQLGHICPNVGRLPCELCGRRQLSDFVVEYGLHNNHRLCSKRCLKVAELFRCQLCFSTRDFYESKGRRDLCEGCYVKETLQCDFCPERVFKGHERYSDGKIVCERCRSDQISFCADCGDEHYHCELDSNLMCKYCRDQDSNPCGCQWCRTERGQRQCSECEEWFAQEDLDGGLCEECRN